MFVDTDVELLIDGDVKARDRVRHRFLADGIQRIVVREKGLYGTFFTPATPGPRPTILIVGSFNGGELALLLAATFPTIRIVAADAPSGVVWQGFDYATRPPRSSWTYKDEPLPCIPFSFGWKDLVSLLSHRLFRKPMEARASFSGFAKDASLLEAATIPVEKINGPVLLFSGGDDRMWPSVELAQIVVDRLERHGFSHPYEHTSYPDAGHSVLGVPGTPTFATDVSTRFVLGGSPEANARAHLGTWPRMLNFFREHL